MIIFKWYVNKQFIKFTSQKLKKFYEFNVKYELPGPLIPLNLDNIL